MERGQLVGRRRERTELDEALRTARAGSLQVVVVSGEAGVGKTRLLEDLAETAEAAGARVMRTACLALGAEGLPLAPATAVVRTLVESGGTRAVTDLLPGADGLLRLLPELGTAGDEPGGQGRLLELFRALLRRLAADRPLVFVIDDLQWADRSTRDLLDLLVRTLRSVPLLLATAYRSDDVGRGHPLRPFLAELARLPGVRRLELAPLSRAETAELLAAELGRVPTPELLDQVYRRAGGNPFYAIELARLAPAGAATPEPAAEAMPESLRDLLVDRVARLPDPVARVVRLVAVAGEPVSHELLAAVAGLADDELLAAVRSAIDAGVLRAGSDGYAPTHRLLREAILADLLPADRVRLHRAYAEVLAADPSLLPPDRQAAAVAFHWYEAGVADRALPALLRAAEAAGRIYAQAEQAKMLDRALRLPVSGQPADLDRIGLYEAAIGAATWAGEQLDALGLVDRALVEADRTRAPGRVALLLAHRGLLLQQLGRDGAATAVDEALELLPDDRSLLRARVLDLVSAVLAVSGEPDRAHEHAAEAAELAEAHGEVGVAINARTTVGWVLGQLGRYQEARAALQAARTAASGVPDPVGLARVDLNLADLALRVGDYPAAVEVARRGLAAAESAGLARTIGALLASQLVAALFATGRWDEAEQVGRQAIDWDPTGAPGAEPHAYLGLIALARGELERAREHLSVARTLLDPAGGQAVPVAILAAELALADNRLDQARQAVTEALPAQAAPYQRWPLLATAARVEALAGPVAGLREAVAELPADTRPYQAYAAQVAAELGDKPDWPAVAEAWEGLGCPYLAAQARLRAAEASLRAGEAGPARELLTEVVARARELGATPLLEAARATARGARISLDDEAAPAPAATGQLPLGLTEREAEVLRLIALGRSNRQIGEALFISPKTVSVHVSNLLGKLGAANRGQAAAIAHRLRLVDDDHQPGDAS